MAFLELLVQSLFMGVGTYLVGSIPVSLSKQRSSAITSHSAALSIFSVGLLISTALAVIIPEGVSVLSRSIQSGKEGEREGEVHEHLDSDAEVGGWIGAALVAGFVLMCAKRTADFPSSCNAFSAGSVFINLLDLMHMHITIQVLLKVVSEGMQMTIKTLNRLLQLLLARLCPRKLRTSGEMRAVAAAVIFLAPALKLPRRVALQTTFLPLPL